MDEDTHLNPEATAAKRLSPIDRSPELHPWRSAQGLTRCFLYWMPTSGFPMAHQERTWLMGFLDRFVETMASQFELRAEAFLGSETVRELNVPFVKAARQFKPILGWSHRPGFKLKPIPSEKEFQRLRESDKKTDPAGTTPDRCYWFLKKAEREQRETFFGHGGMTFLFVKSDPNTKPPELPFPKAVRKMPEYAGPIGELETLVASAFAMKDSFLAKSKQLFGKGLEEAPGYSGVPFILPKLHAEDFFGRPQEECEAWFQLFDVYISESPDDNGVLLASKMDIEEALIGLLKQMRQEELDYTER